MAEPAALAPAPALVLASASPRRAELLRLLGIDFTVEPADIDESPRPDEDAEGLVRRLAVGKAETVAALHPAAAVVIGADTVVTVDAEVLGKPVDDTDARRMLRLLSGRTHRVVTGVAVSSGGDMATAVEMTDVSMVELNDTELDWYLATGDHRDKAGAYGVQGVAGLFITRLEGSFTNVIGLPLTTLLPLLRAAGIGRAPQP